MDSPISNGQPGRARPVRVVPRRWCEVRWSFRAGVASLARGEQGHARHLLIEWLTPPRKDGQQGIMRRIRRCTIEFEGKQVLLMADFAQHTPMMPQGLFRVNKSIHQEIDHESAHYD